MNNDGPLAYKDSNFFKSCSEELTKIAQQSKVEKFIQRKIKEKDRAERDQKEQFANERSQMMKNIVIDYLRTKNYNYTYSVFLRETNTTSEQIVSKSMIATLVDVNKQIEESQQLNNSILQALVIKNEQESRKKELKQIGINVELIVDHQNLSKNSLLMENRLRQVREQVEGREQKFYQKQIENFKKMQQMRIRKQIQNQYQAKYKQDSKKIENQFRCLIEKHQESMSGKNNSKIHQQNQKNLKKIQALNEECRRLKEENKEMIKFKISHKCTDSEQYLHLKQDLRKQRKDIEAKKKELELALKNMNTKVEELVIQKNKILNENKSDNFMKTHKINKMNKDHMIETIYAEMKKSSQRSQILSEQNLQLRESINQLKLKIKELEKYKQKSIDFGNSECQQCLKRGIGNKFIFETKNVMVDVKQSDFETKEEVIEEVQETEDDKNEVAEEIEHLQKVNELKSEMWKIKNKIRLMVDDIFE